MIFRNFLNFIIVLGLSYTSFMNFTKISYEDEINFVLDIPSISLNESVYNYSSKYNDVDKGLYLATDVNLQEKFPIIIASHSGNSKISYFKNLYKLKENDVVKIHKDNYIYVYKIKESYSIFKNGSFKYKDESDVLYLITCSKKDKSKQIVYKAYKEKVEKSSFFNKI